MKSTLGLSRTHTFKLAILALIGAALACGGPGVNISPDNPVVQESIVVEGLTFIEYVEQLGWQSVINPQNIAPWIVSPIPPPQGSRNITFSGWGPTQADLNSNDIPTIVLFEVRPNGCDAIATKGRQLATTTSTSQKWEMPNVEIPSDVAAVGAVVAYDGSDGRDAPFGNLLILNSEMLKSVVSEPESNVRVGFKADFAGRAMPHLCLELWRGAQLLGRVSADKDGNWKIPSVTVGPGDSVIEVRVWLHGENTTYTAFVNHTVRGPVPPEFVWPFGKMDGDNYLPDTSMGCITAWFGSNDLYLTNQDLKTYSFHNGLDIDCKDTINKPPNSTPTPAPDGSSVSDISVGTVRAISSGTVYIVDNVDNNDLGKYVAIDHGSWASMYWHLESIDENILKEGKDYQVQAGTPVGIMGTTGYVIGNPHLHLVAFWWPSDKESARKSYFIPAGAILINLNQSRIDRCEATKNKFNIDWSSYWMQFTNDVRTKDGTSFSACKEMNNQVCSCNEDQ
jgi:hypothetical protein